MINGYLTVGGVAERWNITPRRLQIICLLGEIPNAIKFGRSWEILEDVEKPIDGRVTIGAYISCKKMNIKKHSDRICHCGSV